METLNHTLFLWLNAPAQPPAGMVWLATFFAEYAIWLVPATLVAAWLWGEPPTRRHALQAGVTAVAALLVSAGFGLAWDHPRPFVIGLGHTLIEHAPDSSFPSDHLTLLWSVAFSLLLHPRLRRAGAVLALLGVPMAWARIYVGVHYPFDMVGAAAVSAACAWLCNRPLAQAPFVRRGWVNK
jgi:undecaprenyl-diphosphatase